MSIDMYADNAETTLNGNINNSTGTIVVTDASSFPSDGIFDIAIVKADGTNLEVITVPQGGVSGNTFSGCTRGQGNTSAVSHTSGEKVVQVQTKRAIDQRFLDQISVGPYANLPTENKSGRLFLPNDGFGPNINNGSGYLNYTPWGAPLYPPPTAGWSWLNQNGATIAQSGSGLLLSVPFAAGVSVTGRYRTLAMSSGYTATLAVSASMQLRASTTSFGIFLYDSGGGGIVAWGARTNNGTSLIKLDYTNSTTFNTASSDFFVWSGNPFWFRIVDDGVNRRLQFSNDGLNFCELAAEGRTAFITPDKIGFYVDSNGQAGTSLLTAVSWKEQ